MARLPAWPRDYHVYTVAGRPPRSVTMLLHATIGYCEFEIKAGWAKKGPLLTCPRATWDKEMMFATETHIDDFLAQIEQLV